MNNQRDCATLFHCVRQFPFIFGAFDGVNVAIDDTESIMQDPRFSSISMLYMPRASGFITVVGICATVLACSSSTNESSGGNPQDASSTDSGTPDAGTHDSSVQDSATASDSSAGDTSPDTSDSGQPPTDSGQDTAPDAPLGCPTLGQSRCTNGTVQTCSSDTNGGQGWKTTAFCAADTQECKEENGSASCVALPTCKDKLKNQDESDIDCGGAKCPGCKSGKSCAKPDDCASGACDKGVCQVCKADSVVCHGNRLDKCKTDQTGWTNLKHCNAISGEVCDAKAQTCGGKPAIGTGPSGATGTYYRFAHFTTANSEFKGGADVGSRGNFIYVNRDGAHVDKYRVDLLDSDGDNKMEPNQHPDNPDATGAIEARTLTFLETYDVPIGGTNSNELYITDHDSIVFTRGYTEQGDLFEYDIKTKITTKIVDVSAGFWNQVLGYDSISGKWYSGPPYSRRIFSYDPHDPQGPEWVLEFTYTSLSGDHADGLEVVVDPNTGTPYVYVSDMTSNFIGQFVKEPDGWKQKNLFKYKNTDAEDVEGMGFGALNHFWITNEGYGTPGKLHTLYEVGGGKLQDYVEPS